MYIYGTYIPPLERASLSLLLPLVIKHKILSPNHLLHSHTTYPTSLLYSLFVPSPHPLLPLLPLPYCNPSCCPPALPLLQLAYRFHKPLAKLWTTSASHQRSPDLVHNRH